MSWLTEVLHRRKLSLRRGDQGGFALMAVLGVIALTSLTIAALLGLMLTTIRVTAAQEQGARGLRAADSAIEAAITQMRTDPGPIGSDPCAVATPLQPVTAMAFDQGTAGTGDDVEVGVECLPGTPADSASATDQVQLVGADGYRGDVAWNGFPWNDATGSGMPAGMTPSLVHRGPEALRFDSGLTVRRGAAVLRDPVDGTPAVTAAGQYLQGDPGPLSGAGNACGLLSASHVGTAAGVIDDADGEPVCADAGAQAVTGGDPQEVVGFEVTNADPAVPGCAAAVVQIQPGRYDSIRTASLNARLSGAGGCTNKTFHFLPGVYSFDADSGVADADRNALVLSEPGSSYVFGALATTAPGDVDTLQCDPSVSGATIVLSGRSEIRHVDGRVSICPAFSSLGDQLPAIYQQTSIPPAITGTPLQGLPINRTFSCNLFVPCAAVERGHDIRVDVAANRPVNSLRVLITGSEGFPSNLVTNRWTRFEVRAMAGGGLLCTSADQPGMPNGGLVASYELLTGTCATAIDETSDLIGKRLRAIHRLTLGNVLISTTLTVTDVDLQLNSAFGSGTPADPEGDWIAHGNVASADGQLATPDMGGCETAACKVPYRTVAERFTHRIDLADVDLTLPGELSGLALDPDISQLKLLVRLGGPPAPLPVELQGFSADYFRPEMTTRLEVRTGTGDRCTAEGGWASSAQEIAFDLLGPVVNDSCAAVFESYSDLADADVSLTFELPCIRNYSYDPFTGVSLSGEFCHKENFLETAAPGPGDRVWQVRPPSIDHIALAAATDSYTGPTPTSKVDIDAASNSSFNVAGDVWMPLSDLDIEWSGTATTAPIVDGNLVLNGLGSSMDTDAEMGVVCCSSTRPDSRTVKMVARIGGVERLTVTVRFNDRDPDTGGYSAGHSVEILDWSACAASGCPSVLSAVEVSPP